MNTIKLMQAVDIPKLLAFIRVNSKANFLIQEEIFSEVFRRLEKYSKENNINIELVNPSGERIVLFTATGAFLGASIGLYLAGVPGLLIGGAAGAITGYTAAHVKITVMPRGEGNLIHVQM